jgi:hypothetical protein
MNEPKYQSIGVFAVEVTQFISFDDWVNRASTVAKGINRIKFADIWIDNAGLAMEIGADFMMSRKYDRFPVTVYAIAKSRYMDKYATT